jgi:hypothetical protein
MNVSLEPWHLILLAISFITFLICLAKYFLSQIDKRFDAQEERRTEYSKHWDTQFSKIEEKNASALERTSELEREFLRSQANMSINYVRREDYVRGQTIIEGKLDGLAMRLENRTVHP